MGNLLNGVSFKEPTTVEDCDSTWETDSGGEEEQGDDEEEPEKDGREEGEQQEKKQGGAEQSGTEDLGSEVTAGDKTDTDQSDSNTAEQNIKPKRSFYAARDLYKYRHQYPNIKDLRCQNDLCNLRFYMNKIPFKPDGVYIEEILNTWKCDYDKLEHNHTYIQWLFPLREQGLNFYAKELTTYEIEEFKKTKEAIKRFVLAYKMMLDFFGLKLMDKNGNVSRATNWQERFLHLNESQHNYLRITRILKSLGELGYENFKPPLVKVFLQESVVENTIPNMKQSALEYFVYTIKERKERRRLLRFAYHNYQPSEHFIWGPSKRQKTEQNKTLKKTTPSNRSQRKHSQKSKDTKTEHELERTRGNSTDENAAGTGQMEKGISHAAAEVIPVDDAGNDHELKTEATNNSPSLGPSEHTILPPVIDETNILPIENILKEPDPEHPSKGNTIDNIIIVDTTDEGSKDCLCSLSPVTPATTDITASAGVENEPKQKDKAK
ncbi:opioid growth factor receptor-like protein 1 isoform X2 [Mixophyes fleayi]|uniref:opioid growth factor receptor-like protein 1 isoform X2 n=1 Tax=Mixophyes fleayi TaxID=3061075 RepID=UPI003F4D7B45